MRIKQLWDYYKLKRKCYSWYERVNKQYYNQATMGLLKNLKRKCYSNGMKEYINYVSIKQLMDYQATTGLLKTEEKMLLMV